MFSPNGLNNSLMTTSNFFFSLNRYRTALLLSVMFFFCIGAPPAIAQGWERYYGGNKEDIGEALLSTSDWGFLVVGNTQSFGQPGGDQGVNVYALKVDVDGDLVWQRVYNTAFYDRAKAVVEIEANRYVLAAEASDASQQGPFGLMLLEIDERGVLLDTFSFSLDEVPNLRINDMILAPDGGLLVAGFADYYADKDDDMVIMKISADMELEWHRILDVGVNDRANAIAVIDGGYVVTGQVDSEVEPPAAFGDDIVTLRMDEAGAIVWQRKLASDQNDEGNDIIVDNDGNIVITGFIDADLIIWKYDQGGESTDSLRFSMFGNGNVGEAIVALDEGYVVAGFTEVDDSNLDQLLLEVDQSLDVVWNTSNGDVESSDITFDIVKSKSGGYATAGYSGVDILFDPQLSLMKTDEQGQIVSNVIRGQVFHDIDVACDLDPGEPRLSGWLVRATGDEKTYFATTNEVGVFEMRVGLGSYVVEALPRNDYWESCFPGGVNVGFNQIYDTVGVNFPLKAKYIDCPLMEVDISTPWISNCTDIEYTVNYSNQGTGGTDGAASVEVELDLALSFQSASLPFSFANDTYTFELGNVPYNTEGSFTIQTFMDCDSIVEDQSGLVTARIFPDTLCSPADPGWNGASVSVDGLCEGDETVTFRLSNTGNAAMVSAKSYFIVEEDLMFLTNGFDLDEEQDTTILLPANGSTYRIIAEQVDGHPGNSFPTRAVEGCGTDEEGGYSVGYVTQWPENDGDQAVSIHVDEVLADVPDVAMVAHPKGWQDSLISAQMALTYRVFFRNITQDSVLRVVVRDTLPEGLDISTLEFGASSHPATYDIYENGVIKATFENLELPVDGTSPQDYAFFEYRVAQTDGNATGTVIENSALVIYDYNTPVFTGRTRHVVGAPTTTGLLEVIPTDIDTPDWASDVKVKVFPNPATEYITLEVEGLQGQHELSFTLLNLYGQPVRSINREGHQCTFDRNNLPAGSYIYLVRADGQKIAAGTLIIR